MIRNKNDENDFLKLLQEQLRMLRHLYKTKIRQFKVVFSLLIVFSSFFFFIILLPYISVHMEKERISEQQRQTLSKINQLNNEIDQVNSGISLVRQSNDIFKVLHNQIVHGPEDLRVFAVSLWVSNSSQAVQQDTMHRGFQSCNTVGAGTYEWLDCNVRTKVLTQLDGYKHLMYQNITLPILMVGKELLQDRERIALKEELDYIQQSLIEKLENQKRMIKKYPQLFTLTMSGNTEVNVILNQTFLESWNEYEQIIEPHNNRLKDLLSQIQSNLDKKKDIMSGLQSEKNRLQEIENELVNQIRQINIRLTPPLSSPIIFFLIEMIPLYPMSVALGFLVSISILRDIYQLRRALYQLYKKRHPDSDVLAKEYIVISVPLSIDPLIPTQNQLAHFFILIIPFLFFSITVIMLLYIWFFIYDPLNALSYMTYFNRIIYGILYLLSIALFSYSFVIIMKEYNLKSPFKFKGKQ